MLKKNIVIYFDLLLIVGLYFLQIDLNLTNWYYVYYVPIYAIIGFCLIFFSYSLISYSKLSDGLTQFRFSFLKFYWNMHWEHYLKVSLFEELLLRFLPMLVIKLVINENRWLIILISLNLLFVGIHFCREKVIYTILFTELFFFFFIVNVLYFFWPDFMMPLIIHFIRNMFIGYIKQTNKFIIE